MCLFDPEVEVTDGTVFKSYSQTVLTSPLYDVYPGRVKKG